VVLKELLLKSKKQSRSSLDEPQLRLKGITQPPSANPQHTTKRKIQQVATIAAGVSVRLLLQLLATAVANEQEDNTSIIRGLSKSVQLYSPLLDLVLNNFGAGYVWC